MFVISSIAFLFLMLNESMKNGWDMNVFCSDEFVSVSESCITEPVIDFEEYIWNATIKRRNAIRVRKKTKTIVESPFFMFI